MSTLEELTAQLLKLPPEQLQAIKDDLPEDAKTAPWVPNPGPQTDAFFSEADELFYGGQAGGGKLLKLSEKLVTPHGFIAMGDVAEGNILLDKDGLPCKVTRVFPIVERPELWRLYFDDGSYVDSCADHNWVTFTAKELLALTCLTPEWREARRAKRASKKGGKKSQIFSEALSKRNSEREYGYLSSPQGQVRTTLEIIKTLKTVNGRTNHAIRNCVAPEFEEKNLPIPPYTLGAWLGDGTAASGGFTGVDCQIWERIEGDGFKVTHSLKDNKSHGILGLQAKLKRSGLIKNKHIPQIYLRASYQQRLALLQGLMDTDGTVARNSGSAEFCNTNEKIIDGIYELICSFGWKVNKREGKAKLNGRDCGRKWTLKFTPTEYVFCLERKRKLQNLATRRTTKFRYIVRAEPIPSEAGRCIAVDSPSHTYLVGSSFLPTHNSDLEIGLSLTAHKRSLILRRTNKEASKLVERYADILGTRDGFNGQENVWRLPGGRIIDIGGCQLEEDKQKYKGNPHDLIAFDELPDFSETQYTFIIGWNRSTEPGQRCRVVAAGNPPTTPEGFWVVKRWGAWLDPTHPNPARPGELRWYTVENGKEIEVKGRGPHLINGEEVYAKSRTYIPAALSDNPYLADTDYAARLAAMPEPYRSAYKEGRFDVAMSDDLRQVIPTAWVLEAQKRWTERPLGGVPMCAIGVDVAQGGGDETVLAMRHDGWFAPLISVPGKETPTGGEVAGLVISHRRDGAKVIVDVGGGYGGSTVEHLKNNMIDAISYNGANKSTARTVDRTLGFFNKRAEAWWRFREALDPGQDGGSPIALPPDPQLISDLCAPRLAHDEIAASGIKIESKDEIKKRIGRSPDRGDAVVMSYCDGQKGITHAHIWREQAKTRSAPQVQLGYANRKRRRG